jgi:hypothetical protein
LALSTQYDEEENPLSVFLYAFKAPETRRQYPRRLKVFLDFLKLDGTLEQQSKEFLEKVKQNPQWAQHSLMQFITLQKERARNGEISYSTIANYYKATKLLVEMNSDAPIINWKRISRGIPSGRKAATDRAPRLEEIRKLSEYPDRRIENLVEAFTNNAIDTASSNPTLSLPQSSSTFPRLSNQSNIYRIEKSESFQNSKGDIIDRYNDSSASFFYNIHCITLQ